MRVNYALVSRRPSLLLRLTGLTILEFEALLDTFSSQYSLLVTHPRLIRAGRIRLPGGGQKGAIPDIAYKLLFILMYTRIYPLLIIQGMFFGLAESKACKWVGLLLPVLDASLESVHVKPKRARGRSLEEVLQEFPELREPPEKPNTMVASPRRRRQGEGPHHSLLPAQSAGRRWPKAG